MSEKRPGIRYVLDFLRKVRAPIVIDVGAYMGKVMRLALEANPDCKCFGLEPDKTNFKLLHEKFKDDQRMNVYPMALSEIDGEVRFHVMDRVDMKGSSESNSLYKRVVKAKVAKGKVRSYGEVWVPSMTLDGFMEAVLPGPHYHASLVKMNCEGGEYNIFEAPTLKFLERTEMFFISFHAQAKPFNKPLYEKKRRRIRRLLTQNGFELLNTSPMEKKHVWQVWMRD